LVDAVMQRLALPSADEARAALTTRLSLGMPSLKLLRAIAERVADEDEAIAVEDLCDDDAALDAYLRERDLLDVLGEHESVSFTLDELTRLLPALQPRAYSVASSPLAHPDEVHLTAGIIRWERAQRARIGVASAFLSSAKPGDQVGIAWQPSRHFRMPATDAPLICIGPGTGVAPFRGFLQARAASKGAPVWLLFGARTKAHDFYYRDELEALHAGGTLARLDLAFSRESDERVYVQHRLREAAEELVAWVDRGAHVYLCGDGSAMAPAVEAVLNELLSARGGLAALKDAQRYRRDVY
jgi:sulfite reductase (NADPH) flavoprotein alpha-component